MDSILRLDAQRGVQSTLILSAADGSIIRTSGLLAKTDPAASSTSGLDSIEVSNDLENSVVSEGGNVAKEGAKTGDYFDTNSNEVTKEKSAEEVAKMVFAFVSAAGVLVETMDKEDEPKLLRLRTRKSEIVIVLGQ